MRDRTEANKLMSLEQARAEAHTALDKWIDTPRDPYYRNFGKKNFDPGIIVELGGLTQPLINARLAFLAQKPKTVTVNGKEYLLEDIEKLKEVKQ